MKYRLYCPVGSDIRCLGCEEWLFSPENIPEGNFAVGI